MANQEVKIKVNVDGVIQKELCEVLKMINDKYGLMITNIDIEWLCTKPKTSTIESCKVTSVYKP